MLAPTESEGQLPHVRSPVPVLVRVLPQPSSEEPRQWAIGAGLEIGRDVEAGRGIRITDDGKLSKRHAVIAIRDEHVHIHDRGSKNHTYVNGRQVADAMLRDGDVVRTGGTLFVLRYRSVPEPDAAATDTEITSRLLGHSTAIRKVRREIAQIARASAPVLLIAPTGAGKELAAEAVHGQSGRKRDALVRVNCAGIASTLSESELFGHDRDAFSGARRSHKGFFAQADGGTLFLDEIGDMPAELQPKLLRVLQPIAQQPASPQGGRTPCLVRFRPVGSEQDVEADVRIIAATNVDMAQAVASGGFRADLYQRLQALVVRLPTLVDRREDILWLLHHYANLGRPATEWRTVTARLGELLLLYCWPGNVRELIAVTQRLLVREPSRLVLDLDVLPNEELQRFQQAAPPAFADAADEQHNDSESRPLITRELLERLVSENQGNITKIARALSRSPRQIRRRLEEFGLLPKAADQIDEARPSVARAQPLSQSDPRKRG